jgi:hypothetical protein
MSRRDITGEPAGLSLVRFVHFLIRGRNRANADTTNALKTSNRDVSPSTDHSSRNRSIARVNKIKAQRASKIFSAVK